MALAQNLRSARETAGLSQAELAKRVGVRQTLISQLELGQTRTTKFIYRIAQALGTKAHKLDPSVPNPTGDDDLDEWIELYATFPIERRPALKEIVRNARAMVDDDSSA